MRVLAVGFVFLGLSIVLIPNKAKRVHLKPRTHYSTQQCGIYKPEPVLFTKEIIKWE